MQLSQRDETEAGKRRRFERHLVLKRASIIKGTSNCEIICTVRNQSVGGACLAVSSEARVPEHFLLYVPVDGVAYRAVLKWRRKGSAGVQFDGTEPKPPTHYG